VSDLGLGFLQILGGQTEQVGRAQKAEAGPGRLIPKDRHGQARVKDSGRDILFPHHLQDFRDGENRPDLIFPLVPRQEEVVLVQLPAFQREERIDLLLYLFEFHGVIIRWELQRSKSPIGQYLVPMAGICIAMRLVIVTECDCDW